MQKISAVLERHTHHQHEHMIEPIGYFFVPVFFVLTGMQVDLSTLSDPKIVAEVQPLLPRIEDTFMLIDVDELHTTLSDARDLQSPQRGSVEHAQHEFMLAPPRSAIRAPSSAESQSSRVSGILDMPTCPRCAAAGSGLTAPAP